MVFFILFLLVVDARAFAPAKARHGDEPVPLSTGAKRRAEQGPHA
jgi:hypothetical protein